MKPTSGYLFREALTHERPLQVIGVINAYAAIMAKQIGFKALYLSGAGVANASYGLPDTGKTTLENVLEDAKRIIGAVDLPLLVDIDTGWGDATMIAHAIRKMENASVAAVHIEDQPFEKRCGHLPNKKVIPKEEMAARIKSAVDARQDPSFVIMARTDAYASEGIERTLERCLCYEEAGADMHFIEALSDLGEYDQCSRILSRPILANITEFGKTPLFTRKELASVGVDLILYPLSAWRAMNLASLKVFEAIRREGTQKSILDQMQTREELYGFLEYESYEKSEMS